MGTSRWARPTPRRASSRNAWAMRGCISRRSTGCGRIITSVGQPTAMLERANEFLAFAERENETGPIMVGYRLVGTSRLINGDIAEASDALHQALVRYDPDEHGAASPV